MQQQKIENIHYNKESVFINKLKINILTGMLFFIFLIIMLMFPKETLRGASSGLLLWFNTLLPVLLPFIILSGILIRLNIVPLLSAVLYPILKHFFPITPGGAYPVFIGFLSGLPVGAKVSAELVSYKKISREEAVYTASMCNNASPAFIINYAAASHLLDSSKGLPLLIITYISSIFASRIVYKFYIQNNASIKNTSVPVNELSTLHISNRKTCRQQKRSDQKLTSQLNTSGFSILNAVDSGIMSAFETVTKIGGYIILFSILTEFTYLLHLPAVLAAMLSSFLEITTGVKNIGLLGITSSIKFILISTFIAFGGLSAAAQTQSVMSPAGLPIKPYIISKVIQGMTALILSSLFILLKTFM